jgi:hypothetical protein
LRSSTWVTLKTGALGSSELGQGNSGAQRSLSDQGRVGVGVQGAVVGQARGYSQLVERTMQRAQVLCADHGASGVQELGLGALGDDSAVADHHDVVGDDLNLV